MTIRVIEEAPVPVAVGSLAAGAAAGYFIPTELVKTIATTLGGLTARAACLIPGVSSIDLGLIAGMTSLATSYPTASAMLVGGAGLTVAALSPIWVPAVARTAEKVSDGVSWAWNKLPNCRNRAPAAAVAPPLAPPPPAPVALTQALAGAALAAGRAQAAAHGAVGAAAAAVAYANGNNINLAGKVALAARLARSIVNRDPLVSTAAAAAGAATGQPANTAAYKTAYDDHMKNAVQAAVQAAAPGDAAALAVAMAASNVVMAYYTLAVAARPAAAVLLNNIADAAGAAAQAAAPANAADAAREAAIAAMLAAEGTDADAAAAGQRAFLAATAAAAAAAAVAAPPVAVVPPNGLQAILAKIPQKTGSDIAIATASAVALVGIAVASSVGAGVVAGTVGLIGLAGKKYHEYTVIDKARIEQERQAAEVQARLVAQGAAAANAVIIPRFTALPAFEDLGREIHLDEAAIKSKEISATPYTIGYNVAKPNGLLAAPLQMLGSEPYIMKELPKAIQRRLKESDLFPKGVKDVFDKNPGLAPAKVDALVDIGTRLRARNSTIDGAGLTSLCTSLRDLRAGGLPESGLTPANIHKIAELSVLLELRECYEAPVITAGQVENLYDALKLMGPYLLSDDERGAIPFPAEIAQSNPELIVKSLTNLLEEQVKDERLCKVRYTFEGEDDGYAKAPELRVRITKAGTRLLPDISLEKNILTGKKPLAYKLTSLMSWRQPSPDGVMPVVEASTHATATVSRDRFEWYKSTKWKHCNNAQAGGQVTDADPKNFRNQADTFLTFSRPE